MYHITDFEVAFESDKEEDSLLEHPQQQCLPVEDSDDLEQSVLTIDGRRYLRQVRLEAANYPVFRTLTDIPGKTALTLEMNGDKTVSKQGSHFHPLWNSKALLVGVLHNVKYTRKLIKHHRNQVTQARTDFEVHFDLSRAVRTRQWWLEYCFGSPRSRHDSLWDDESTHFKDSLDAGQDVEDEEEDEDDDDDDDVVVSEEDKLDFAWDKLALGESMLASLHLCLVKEKSPPIGNAYANGHQPQISFLCELDQTEVVRVLRFFRIWLRRDGYRPQLGLWLFALLTLLDSVQTGGVYHELRVLFASCNLARMQTLMMVSSIKVEKDKCQAKLVPSSCISVSPVSSSSGKCSTCEQVRHLRKQHSTLCLVMLLIGHFFGQKDLIGALECDLNGVKSDAS